MNDLQRTVTVIPAKPQRNQQAVKRQLRVAAYCRVSTEEEEQQSSYEAQCTYYTDKIMTNPEWTMAGIFADEGITGTSTKKRDDFNRMIRKCRQKKIDLILTKSMSRFARNTLDSLKYIRALKELGIGIIFEKENINTLEMDTELIITFMSAFAQSESESISANVRWGKRQAMKEGKTSVNFKKLYGYFLDSEGNPRVDSDQAEVIRGIYNRYLQGASLRMIRQELEATGIPNPAGSEKWGIDQIRNILSNEKYCGDVLMQKTFIQDCISKKVVKNTGQLVVRTPQSGYIVSSAFWEAGQIEGAAGRCETGIGLGEGGFCGAVGGHSHTCFPQVVPCGPMEIADDIGKLFDQLPVRVHAFRESFRTQNHAVGSQNVGSGIEIATVVVANDVHRIHAFADAIQERWTQLAGRHRKSIVGTSV